MNLNVQDLLRNNGFTPEMLTEKLGIAVKRHPKYPNLMMLKYDQIESPMGNKAVQECRGIILDAANNWNVVSFPFAKFFNVEEGHATKIDWSTAEVQEKLDGSLMTLYWWDGAWQVASSGLPDAGGQFGDMSPPLTFSEMFWEIWGKLGYQPVPSQYKDYCFMFEMMTPYNRIVVQHKTSRLALIGVRNIVTGQEYSSTEFAQKLGFEAVRTFPLNSLAAVTDSFRYFDGINQEGYVVVDAKFNRVKIKHPSYVALHHMRGNGSPTYKSMYEVISNGESEELLSYFPEWRPMYEDIRSRLTALIEELRADYSRITTAVKAIYPPGVIVSESLLQKEFASLAIKTRCPSALFSLKANKTQSLEAFFAKMNPDHALKLLGVKE